MPPAVVAFITEATAGDIAAGHVPVQLESGSAAFDQAWPLWLFRMFICKGVAKLAEYDASHADEDE